MSDDLPRCSVPPLPPPPGRFDDVLSAAHHRRMRRLTTVLTVSGVFVAGIAGGFALDRPATEVPTALVDLARGVGNSDPGGAAPSEGPSNSASVTREEEEPPPAPKSPSPTPRPVSSPPQTTNLTLTETAPPGPSAVHGVALGVAGQPASGLYIYPGVKGTDGFVPTAEPVGRTAKDGSFSLPCSRTPVLLAPWRLNEPAGQQAETATWAATFVGGVTDVRSALAAPCSTDGTVTRTIVQPGSTVSGTVVLPEACGPEVHSLRLWLHNEPTVSVRVADLLDGDSYRIGGLPPGQHTLAASGNRRTVTVGGGETVTADVTFGCDDGSTPSPTPTGSPVPPPSAPPATPAPSGTPSPSPSSSEPATTPSAGAFKR